MSGRRLRPGRMFALLAHRSGSDGSRGQHACARQRARARRAARAALDLAALPSQRIGVSHRSGYLSSAPGRAIQRVVAPLAARWGSPSTTSKRDTPPIACAVTNLSEASVYKLPIAMQLLLGRLRRRFPGLRRADRIGRPAQRPVDGSATIAAGQAAHGA